MKLPLTLLACIVTLAACDTAPPVTGRDACDYIADACHGGTGVAETCHELGHDGVLGDCEAMLASCLVACTYDAGSSPDAAEPADAGVDAPTTPDAGTADVVLAFSPRMGDAPFSCAGTFSLGTPAADARPTDFRFYVHDVRLLTPEGDEVPLTLTEGPFSAMGVALIDFEDATGTCVDGDAETNLEVRGTAPARAYSGVVFRIGVPFELNHVDLTTLPAPLNRTSLFWSWGLGHIFFAASATHVASANTRYTHVGSTQCTGDPAMGDPVTSCGRPNRPEIRLTSFDPTADVIVADFAEVVADDDLSGESCHSFSDDCAFAFDALGLNYATGSLTPSTQTVFRVE